MTDIAKEIEEYNDWKQDLLNRMPDTSAEAFLEYKDARRAVELVKHLKEEDVDIDEVRNYVFQAQVNRLDTTW